jgi:transcriptional regulator with XRE-family HTH domain
MVKKAAQATPNKLLRAARKERGWTQEVVAQHIGAPQPLNITRWERGLTVPSPYYIERLCALFERSARELGLVQDAGSSTPGASPQLHVPLPIQATPLIGRERETKEICALLR